jgi:hypothetical protein
VNDNDQSATGARATFRQLFARHSLVEVPIVQRDYVQGRESAAEVRAGFVDALFSALTKPKNDPSLPLDLDFVYGSVEGADRKAFSPLDGQQRLTTLFLLHWYLAWQDGKLADFRAFAVNTGASRFAYAVRPSSGEFFDALASWDPGMKPREAEILSELIADQPWFFRSWTLDPTIQAVLTMLDALHEKFGRREGLYERLIDSERPCITFQLLDLRSFGLSDDLYIKMNARGKPLTSFETFKARFEQHLDSVFPEEKRELRGVQVSVKDYFSHRIDTDWADLFWRHRDKQTQLFDDRVMQLIRALVMTTRDPDHPAADRVLDTLGSQGTSYGFLKLKEDGCLDRPLLETLIAMLDGWCGAGGELRTHLSNADFFNEARIFERAITRGANLTYEELIQLHAYCAYIVKHGHALSPGPFTEWMRVIGNLSANSTYDRVEDYQRSIRALKQLMHSADNILEYLSDPESEVRGFNEQQVQEEKLKAQLLRSGKEWRPLILEAERHGYFRGQIQFLLKFCGVLDRWLTAGKVDWSPDEDAALRKAFADYLAKAGAVFSHQGLKDFGEFRWERALLAIGNYLLPKSGNESFLNDSDRDASWKRLLRGGTAAIEAKRLYVQSLLEQIDLNLGVPKSLDAAIAHSSPGDEWRRLIVDKAESIKYCKNRMIRVQSDDLVYLMSKTRMSGEHAELFGYDLYLGLLSDKERRKELAPFGELGYTTVHSDWEEPRAYLVWRHGEDEATVLKLTNRLGKFELKLSGKSADVLERLRAKLVSFKVEEDGSLTRTVERSYIESTLDELVSAARTVSVGTSASKP